MRRIDNIVLHHSAGAMTVDAIRRIHVEENGWSSIGYHYIVSPESGVWRVYIGRPVICKGAHCPKRNRDSIGICVCGNYELADLSQEAYEVLFDLCIRLCVKWDIAPDAITGHFKWKDTLCPGKGIKSIMTKMITSARDMMPLEGY